MQGSYAGCHITLYSHSIGVKCITPTNGSPDPSGDQVDKDDITMKFNRTLTVEIVTTSLKFLKHSSEAKPIHER